MTTPRYDVVIVGAGAVGASLAAALDGQGWAVAVVDAAPPPERVGGRELALAAGSRYLLEALRVWPDLAGDTGPIRAVHVSSQGHFGSLQFHCGDRGRDPLGYVVEEGRLRAALESRLADTDAAIWRPWTVERVMPRMDGAYLYLRAGRRRRRLDTRLVVAADGARSRVRQGLGIAIKRRDYRQTALLGRIAPTRPHDHEAFERFLRDDGVLALLPCSDGHCALIWSAPSGSSVRLAAADDATFEAALQTAFGWRLGALRLVGGRAAHPLALVRARERVGPRVVLVGNAAQALHPVAAQGFNLGLRDAVVLARILEDAARRGDDPGGARLLAAYRQARCADGVAAVGITDALARAGEAGRGPAGWLRAAGLVALDRLSPVKRGLAGYLMGLDPPGPLAPWIACSAADRLRHPGRDHQGESREASSRKAAKPLIRDPGEGPRR